MIRRFVPAVVPMFAALIASTSLAAPRPSASSDRLEGLGAFIESTMAEWKVPGLAIAVVQDGRVVHLKGYGFRDIEAKKPVTQRTLFAIGSITKSITAVGLSILADEGKLEWDKPVRAMLPEFRLKDPAADAGVTPRDLLSHRTGLPRHDLLWYGSGLSRRALLDRLDEIEPSRPLRATWQYNNLMFLAAGCLTERISGRSWEEFTHERILQPLGMNTAKFSVNDSQKADDTALPYDKSHDTVRRVPFYNLDALGPAGSINANVEEMAHYVQFHLDRGKFEGKSLLSERSARLMQTAQMVVPDDALGALFSTRFDEIGPTTYGLGLFLTTYRGHALVWHSGSIDGFSALMSLLPKEKIGVIVLTNLSGNRPVPTSVTRNVLDRLLGLEPIDWVARAKDLEKPAKTDEEAKGRRRPRSGTSPSHARLEYAGVYENPAYGAVTIAAESDRLALSWRGAHAPLVHRHYDVFDTGVADDDDNPIPRTAVSFTSNKSGEIDRLAMPLESNVADVVFLRKAGDKTASGDVASRATDAPFDVILLGGRIVDGTGNAWYYGDVALRGDRIARITPPGQLKDATAAQRIDASGLVVAPGFIDIQGQSRDELLTGDSRLIGKVTQGVTTEILGEGDSNAPAKEPKEFDGPHGFNAWLEAMQKHRTSVNFGSFVGSATVRSYVKGMARGAPTADELETMRGLVRHAMEDGAFGLASALIYPPDNFVSTDDLIALSKVMAPYGGVYITHMRSEGDHLLEGIDEAIRIGKEGGVPVEIYHLKAAGKRNWSKATQAVDKIAAARAGGQDVSADMYPYAAAGTGLTACLPPWTAADGKLFDNLADKEVRARIRAEVLDQKTEWENMGLLATPEGILILGLKKPENAKFVGKRLAEIAALRGQDWLDTAMDLILSERQRVETIYFLMSEENVAMQLRQPWIKLCTDAAGHDPEHPGELVHPRSYGTYPRVLGKYVRDDRVLALEEAVRKMSSAVATRLSIHDRGLLREGFLADLVVFDPQTVGDRATFEKPHQVSAGIRDVFVNGVAVVRDGRHTGAKPGRIVRGPGCQALR